MSSLLEELLKLFAIDQQLLALKNTYAAGPATIKAEESKIATAREERRLAEETVRTKSAEVDQCSLDIRTAEGEIEEQEVKLKGIKNNKEYKIVTERIKDLKQIIETKEGQTLAAMEELDGLRASLREKLDAVKEGEARIEELKKKCEEDAVSIRQEVDELKVKRAEQIMKVEKLDPTIMEVYRVALRRGQGAAMAELANGACQACFRQPSPNVANIVVVGRDLKKCICAGCGRLLYAKQAVDTPSSGTD